MSVGNNNVGIVLTLSVVVYVVEIREVTFKYSNHVGQLGKLLFELLSESLGLPSNYLEEMECAKGHALVANYYPPCPEPNLTLGTSKHSDPDFLTILVQDQVGGLRVLYQQHWIDVPPVAGALLVNIGDLLQLMTNDKFKSVEHRVLANKIDPRVSVACFFTMHLHQSSLLYGPIKELLSDENPPVYKDILLTDFVSHYDSKGLDGRSALSYFRL
ncbi:LOW QUALITY PROTEIN: 1-aminocyclopropane-1-carboxylate oxidase homolog 1-like [Ananas comosus]|uniref:LOW QUALITY PROTEIN: 1-aminocyclopropane-1-carboxylate oxidase homolog 1-like n=1 Tax=Ananas comosus TaxID=4615 RepID=A0A6P5FGL7_ANACO|nr:LOW QUALITY PROTEIN: 1-aminocyclopropane-1-carboxylate oxidase homolog 1-like [Ananas comosus]